MSVDFYLLDSRVSATALEQSPYHAYRVGQPVTYLEPSGIYLRLFGRSVDGQSVVVEAALRSGLTLSFLDEHDSAMSDDLYAQTVEDELKQRACANQPELVDIDDLTASIVRKPCFYGFEPDSHDPLSPRIRRVVELSTHSLKLHHALRRAAEHALHDEPLDCGARPCELSAAPHAAAMEALDLHHGTWVRAAGQNTAAAAAADVTILCAITNLTPLPELNATLPPLVLASYDIECSSGEPDAAGNYAFPDAFKPDHAVRCVAVVATSLGAATDAATTRRFFLHTGPRTLTAEHHCATAAADEGAAEAAVNLEVRHFSTEAGLLQGLAALLRNTIRPDVLYSYNGNAFDAPFLAQRIEQVLPTNAPDYAAFDDRAAARGRCRAAHGWGRTPMNALPPKTLGVPKTEEQLDEIKRKRAQGKVIYEPKAFDAPGMAHHDVLDFGHSLNLETSKLADVAAEVLGGITKTDLAISDMFDILRTNDLEGWARVAVYNVRDAELPLRIMIAKDQVAFNLQIAAVSGCTLPQVCAGGQQKRLQSMVSCEVRARGLIYNEPSKIDFVTRPWLCGGGEKVKGATVLDIKPGWYRDPVVTCDYSSLYPSIVISRNLCPSKLLLDAVQPTLPADTPPALAAAVRTFRVEERDADLVHHHHVLQRDGGGVGVFPAISERLLVERKAAKCEMKQHSPGTAAYAILDAKQQALKVICNSLYGALNAVLKGSLYCRPLGGIVTAEGRAAIATIQAEVAQLPGAEVVAGDTDSVMFKLVGCTLAEAEVMGTAVAASVTARLRADGAHAMELAYEKTMLPSVFVAKKAYAYVCHVPGKSPTHVSMGLMSKKRGTAALFKDAFIDCERVYLLDPERFSAEDVRRAHLLVLRDLERRLATAPPEAFVNTTMLKPETAYAPSYNAQHVNAARRLVTATGCTWPGNARFRYVQAQPGAPLAKSKKKASDFSMELGYFIQSKATIDTSYYVSSVHKRFEALLHFSLPDAPARFAQLLTTLERRPANTKSIASHYGAAPAAPPPLPLIIAVERAYLAGPHAEDTRVAETAFWQAALASASQPKQAGPFSDGWRAPRPLASGPAAPNAMLFGGKRTKDETEGQAVAAVTAKQQKLADNSAAIAAQSRRGAVNQVPAANSRARPKGPSQGIASFFARVQP